MSNQDMKAYEIVDRVQPLKFTGRIIGQASTQRPGVYRWTDIIIYKTEGGHYVVQRVGRSIVYHVEGNTCARGELVKNEEIDYGFHPCTNCNPPAPEELDRLEDSGDETDYRMEVDMSAADVTTDPLKIVQILTYRGKLAGVAAEAIEKASHNDEELKKSLNVVRHID